MYTHYVECKDRIFLPLNFYEYRDILHGFLVFLHKLYLPSMGYLKRQKAFRTTTSAFLWRDLEMNPPDMSEGAEDNALSVFFCRHIAGYWIPCPFRREAGQVFQCPWNGLFLHFKVPLSCFNIKYEQLNMQSYVSSY